MKRSSFKVLSIIFLVGLGFIHGQAFADNNKEKIKVKILENTSFGECLYSSNVAVEVKYKLKNFADDADTGQIILEATQDGTIFYQVLTKEVEAGRGSSVLIFDAGECTRDIQISNKISNNTGHPHL